MRGTGREIALKLMVGAAVAAVATFAVLGAASAHKPRIKTHVTIDEKVVDFEVVFFGDITARKHACERGRRVTLFNGTTPQGSTRSDGDGHWEVTIPSDHVPGFHVKVHRKTKRHFVCKSADKPLSEK